MRRTFLIVMLNSLPMLLLAQKDTPTAAVMAAGKTIYIQRCMTCHQVDGTGAQNMIPPLIKTDYVLGAIAPLIKILLNGMTGEIKVNGDIYAGEMPSHAF
jgi:cytochrome c